MIFGGFKVGYLWVKSKFVSRVLTVRDEIFLVGNGGFFPICRRILPGWSEEYFFNYFALITSKRVFSRLEHGDEGKPRTDQQRPGKLETAPQHEHLRERGTTLPCFSARRSYPFIRNHHIRSSFRRSYTLPPPPSSC